MFSRAERFASVTTDHSPAFYNLRSAESNDTKACRVPFNCSAPAQALADNNVPAPCTYNITYREHRVQGGASLRFKEPRVTLRPKVSPSPLTYDPDFVYIKPPKKTLEGEIFRGKPPRYGNVSPISVPYKYFNGFNIITGDYLVKRPPAEEFTRPIEPIYYNFPFEVNKVTLKYKGNHWSKMTSTKKTILSGDPCSPGVCTYDLLDKPQTEFEKYLDNVRFYNRATIKSLRSLDILEKRLLILTSCLDKLHGEFLRTKDEPGPGYYNLCDSDFEPKVLKETFSRVPRFLPDEPDFRLLTDLCNAKIQVSHQKIWPPFNCISRREVKSLNTSPADYLVWNHTVAYNLAKDLYSPRVAYPFNSSVERVCGFGNNSTSNPGPCQYEFKRFPYNSAVNIFGKRDVNSYVRPLKLSPVWKVPPREVAPWSYEVDSSFNKLCRRSDFHRGAVWRREKCDRTKWLVDNRSADAIYTYEDPMKSLRRNNQLPFCGRPREKIPDDRPGPADYTIHPLYREGLVRAFFTFNRSGGKWRPVRKDVERPKNFRKYCASLPWPHSLIFELINELS